MQEHSNALAQASVHIGGMGRIGTSIALALHAAGVGEISCNDPQNFEEEQFSVCVYSRRSDIGRPKAHVLERFMDGRPNLNLTSIVARNQSPLVMPYLEKATVIVSCANSLAARLYLERMAIRLRKPCVQAAVHDARTAIGGVVTVWRQGAKCSCFGCLFPGRKHFSQRGEVLLPTVTGTIATLAAHVIRDLLLNKRSNARWKNAIFMNLQDGSMERLAVVPRSGCGICRGGQMRECENRAGRC